MNQIDLEIISHSPEDTREIGKILGEHSQLGQVFLLFGELGTGKTCLTQGILKGLGETDFVTSPTFTLIKEYYGRLNLYHIDLFRLERSIDLEEIGLGEYLNGDGLCVIEWPERIPELPSKGLLRVRMSRIGDQSRRIQFSAVDRDYSELLRAIGLYGEM